MVDKARAEWRPDTRRRAGQMLDAAAETIGVDAAQLDTLMGESDRTRPMTGLAIVAAERAFWPLQVVAVGRVLAAGLIADGYAVDVAKYALDAMSEMGRLHISLLDLLVRYEPDWDARGYRAVPHSIPSYVSTTLAPSPDSEMVWSVGRRIWAAELVPVARPELGQVLTGLIGTLIRHGLAEQTDKTREAIEQISKEFQDQINRQTAAASRGQRPGPLGQRPPAIRKLERCWSPTELRQQVHRHYLE